MFFSNFSPLIRIHLSLSLHHLSLHDLSLSSKIFVSCFNKHPTCTFGFSFTRHVKGEQPNSTTIRTAAVVVDNQSNACIDLTGEDGPPSTNMNSVNELPKGEQSTKTKATTAATTSQSGIFAFLIGNHHVTNTAPKKKSPQPTFKS